MQHEKLKLFPKPIRILPNYSPIFPTKINNKKKKKNKSHKAKLNQLILFVLIEIDCDTRSVHALIRTITTALAFNSTDPNSLFV